MKNIKMLVLLVLLVATVGFVIAEVCPAPVVIDTEALPFPVEVSLIQHRLLGGAVLLADVLFNRKVEFCEPDGDFVTFEVTNKPEGMSSINTPTGVILSWTPTEDQAGTYYVNIKVTDAPKTEGIYSPDTVALSDEGTVVFQVYKTNNAPVLLTW